MRTGPGEIYNRDEKINCKLFFGEFYNSSHKCEFMHPLTNVKECLWEVYKLRGTPWSAQAHSASIRLKDGETFFWRERSHVFKRKVSRLWSFINFTGGQLLWPAGYKVKLALAIISYVFNVHNLRLVCLLFSASPSSCKYNWTRTIYYIPLMKTTKMPWLLHMLRSTIVHKRRLAVHIWNLWKFKWLVSIFGVCVSDGLLPPSGKNWKESGLFH